MVSSTSSLPASAPAPATPAPQAMSPKNRASSEPSPSPKAAVSGAAQAALEQLKALQVAAQERQYNCRLDYEPRSWAWERDL